MNKLSLYEIEDNLLALVNSEELVTEEHQEVIAAEIAGAGELARSKRDNVARFILAVEAAVEAKQREAKRLTESAKSMEARLDNFKRYVTTIVNAFGARQGKGKSVGLDGEIYRLSAQRNPSRVVVLDEAKIPDGLKRVTLRMSGDEYVALVEALEGKLPHWTVEPVEILLKGVREAVEAGELEEDVAVIKEGELRLVVK